jgi:hypothetical protein
MAMPGMGYARTLTCRIHESDHRYGSIEAEPGLAVAEVRSLTGTRKKVVYYCRISSLMRLGSNVISPGTNSSMSARMAVSKAETQLDGRYRKRGRESLAL